nr:cytosine permease [uncultured Pseudogulbenkiania sp.]
MSNQHNQAAVAADKAWSIEQHALEPIPVKDRHGSPKDLFKMWLGANINYVVVVTGAMAYSQGLSFWQAIAAILAGNLLGCLVVGFSTIMGPKTGTAGIVVSRSSFGQLGSFFPKAVSLISALSWFSINSVVATEALETIMKMGGFTSSLVVWISLAIILAAEIILAIFGHATIIAAEKWIAMILATLFAGLVYFVYPHADLAQHLLTDSRSASMSTWLVAMGVVCAFPIGWANFASDYSRYFPSETSWKKIALFAGGGQFVALTVCEIIGVLFAMAVGGNLGYDPVGQLDKFLPAWFMVPLLLAIIVGGIAANVPNGYTAGLGLLALRIPISRVASLGIIALFTLGFRVMTVFYGSFYSVYETFLGYMVFWTGPWAAIITVDYFMRKGRYNSADMMKWGQGDYWYNKGIFWPGLIAWLAGISVSVLFSNSPVFASPLMTKVLGWGDVGFEFGLLVPGLLYYFLAKNQYSFKAGCRVEAAVAGSSI